MIPSLLLPWATKLFGQRFAKPFLIGAGIIVLILALGLAVLAILHFWRLAASGAGEARLERNQASALSNSATDAIDVLGDRQALDEAIDTITKENDYAIHSAPGADAPVDPAVRAAGLAGLCRRAAYQCEPRCVQFASPGELAQRCVGRTASRR